MNTNEAVAADETRLPSEFTRVGALNQSCGAEDFDNAWISIE
jgi:hypothetical protein